MSDVFVSYARPDEAHAKRVAEVLRADGHDVWRDDELPAHRAYADVIQERLTSADAVVVLWSAEAAKSQWVRAEADAARAAGTLVQVTLDGSLPPLPFNQIQCADLTGCGDQLDASGWHKLKASIAALTVADGPPHGVTQSRMHRTETSICVLPFANMSADIEQEYFSDGISEDITTDLSKVSALGVTARNTAFTFKGHASNVCDIARGLGVSYVLEGSVRKAGGRVRITAQLIDGTTGDHVWAERYDRDLTDIFAIQDEISHAIVDALKVKLLPEEKKALEQRGTTRVDAYNLYLLARKYFTAYFGGGQQEEKIIRICKRAVELDPNYAKAWGLMAWVQSMLFTYKKDGEDGVAAAQRALSLDEAVACAHCVMARRFHELGRESEAENAIRQALSLEPDAWEVVREAGRTFYNQNRFTEATPYLERALTLVQIDFSAWQMLASAYKAMGDQERLLRAAETMMSHSQGVLDEDPGHIEALAMNACGSAISGDASRFYERVELALLLDPENMLGRYNFACTSAVFLDDLDMALELLAPVLTSESAPTFVKFAIADPDLSRVREEPRFQELLSSRAEMQAT
jgi:adenylate cyclase